MNWQALSYYFQTHTSTAVKSLFIVIVGGLLARYIKIKLYDFLRQHTKDPTITLYAVNVVYALILIILTVILLGQLGVPTASLITLLGAGGLAIGLALRDSLSNIAGGFMLIIQKPFRQGDFIEISGSLGTVEQINLFNTRLKTPNNEGIYIPNGKVLNEIIVNKTYQKIRRLDISIGISYDADLNLAKELLKTIMENHDRILPNPKPVIGVKELADSAVIVTLRPWVNKEDYNEVHFHLLEAIKKAFDEHKITIPYQQMDVHIRK